MKKLFCLLLAAAFTACNPQAEKQNAPSSVSAIQITSESGSVTVEENRVIITLRDGFERIGDAKSVYIRAVDYQAESEPVRWEGAATNYSGFALPYWVVYPQFTHAGAWLLEAVIETAEGKKVEGTLGVNVEERPYGLTAGMAALPSETRTASSQEELLKITSDPDPNPAYYQMTIAQALENGKPSLIAFATPGLCQTKACAPVLDTVDALWEKYRQQLNFIHVEVYQDFEPPLEYVATMREWGLVNEPWVYVVDKDGIIVARYDAALALEEIEPVIKELLDAS